VLSVHSGGVPTCYTQIYHIYICNIYHGYPNYNWNSNNIDTYDKYCVHLK